MNKNIKSFLYTFFFLYVIYLCIKGLVKLFWRPKNQEDLYVKTKIIFILFFLVSLFFVFGVYYVFEFEQVNRIYEISIYFVFIMFIIGILNNQIFNIGYGISINQEKKDINDLYNYFKKNKK
jgi:hypothetical protein